MAGSTMRLRVAKRRLDRRNDDGEREFRGAGSAVDRGVDRNKGSRLADSFVRLLPKDGSPKIKISYAEIAALAFTGRDMAAGKSWENWVRHYWEKKATGEKDISLQPEKLE